MPSGPQPDGQRGFDWPVYADATFAGLAILIPIPLVDMLFEAIFRGRMPAKIAACRNRVLDPGTIRDLNHKPWTLFGCLFFPIWLVLMFLKRLFRTVLYFLTVKDATDKLSLYWHRAFLIDLAIGRGHLDDREESAIAVAAIRALLDEITTSPLTNLASQMVSGVKHVLRSAVRRLRRRGEDEVARVAQQQMGRQWADMRAYFDQLAAAYDRAYARLVAANRAEANAQR